MRSVIPAASGRSARVAASLRTTASTAWNSGGRTEAHPARGCSRTSQPGSESSNPPASPEAAASSTSAPTTARRARSSGRSRGSAPERSDARSRTAVAPRPPTREIPERPSAARFQPRARHRAKRNSRSVSRAATMQGTEVTMAVSTGCPIRARGRVARKLPGVPAPAEGGELHHRSERRGNDAEVMRQTVAGNAAARGTAAAPGRFPRRSRRLEMRRVA